LQWKLNETLFYIYTNKCQKKIVCLRVSLFILCLGKEKAPLGSKEGRKKAFFHVWTLGWRKFIKNSLILQMFNNKCLIIQLKVFHFLLLVPKKVNIFLWFWLTFSVIHECSLPSMLWLLMVQSRWRRWKPGLKIDHW